jgi:hypothetical protein
MLFHSQRNAGWNLIKIEKSTTEIRTELTENNRNNRNKRNNNKEWIFRTQHYHKTGNHREETRFGNIEKNQKLLISW